MNFKKAIQLQRKRAAAKAAPQRKPVSEMSEQELDAELRRAQSNLVAAKRNELSAARDAAETGSERGSLQAFLSQRRKARRIWK